MLKHALLAAGLIAAATQAAQADANRPKICFVTFSLQVAYFQSSVEGGKTEAAAQGAELIVLDPQADAQKQVTMAEDCIARATAFAAKLVIMDEPTANLGATAIDKVRETIRRLKANDLSVILISHRLEDVFAVSDRVMVLKHGRVVGTRVTAETAADEVLHMIIAGRHPRTAQAASS